MGIDMTKRTHEELATMLREAGDGYTVSGSRWRHKASGKEYYFACMCLREHDLEPCVVYVPLNESAIDSSFGSVVFCRPLVE